MRILHWRGPWVIVVVLAMSTACTGAATVSVDGPSDPAVPSARGLAAAGADVAGAAGEPITIGGTLGLTGAFAGPAAAYHAA
jgi:hypothetical protein